MIRPILNTLLEKMNVNNFPNCTPCTVRTRRGHGVWQHLLLYCPVL